jgi:Mg2+ and Co2+ transporter CorA
MSSGIENDLRTVLDEKHEEECLLHHNPFRVSSSHEMSHEESEDTDFGEPKEESMMEEEEVSEASKEKFNINWDLLDIYMSREDKSTKQGYDDILFTHEDLLNIHKKNEMRRSLESESYRIHPLRHGSIAKFQFYNTVCGVHRATTLKGLLNGHLIEMMKQGPFWLDICQPDVQDMRMLEDVFGIHPLTTEDILTADTREKCEMYPNYLFMCVRALSTNYESATFLEGVNVYFLITSDFLIVCHEKPVVDSQQIMKRLERLKLTIQIGTDWIM